MNATIIFQSPEMATWFVQQPELAGCGFQAQIDGAAVTTDLAALAVLRELAEDVDGHFDGTYVWIGGSEYRVIRDTGRPAIGPEVKTRVTEDEAAELTARAKTADCDRSELIRRYIRSGLSRPEVTIVTVDHPTALFSTTPGQAPYVVLNTATGVLTAGIASTHADDLLSDRKRGYERWITYPYTPRAINAILDEMRPVAQQFLDAHLAGQSSWLVDDELRSLATRRGLVDTVREQPVQEVADLDQVQVECGADADTGKPADAEVSADLAENDGDECEGHESLAGEHMGETVFCDGTCR